MMEELKFDILKLARTIGYHILGVINKILFVIRDLTRPKR